MKVSGLDEIRLRYTASFVVEADELLADDKPMAYKIRPLKPLSMAAMGLAWPIATDGRSDSDDEIDRENVTRVMRIVARSIVAARELYEGEDGAWQERWTPIEVVCDRAVNPDAKVREIHVEDIDYLDTISRIWNELLRRFQLHRGNGRSSGRRVRRAGNGKSGEHGEDVREVAARTGVRKKRRTKVRSEAASGEQRLDAT